jgi:hypothetical protein
MVQSLSLGEKTLDLIPTGSGLPLPSTDGGVDPHDASAVARYVSVDFTANTSPAAEATFVRFIVDGPVPVGPGDPVEHYLHFQKNSERGWAISANFGGSNTPAAMLECYLRGARVGEPRPLEDLQVPSLPLRVAASTGVSPTGAEGWALYWSEAVAIPGQPLPWDEIRLRPLAASIVPPFPWYARFRVKYDEVEEMMITHEQTLPARPSPLSIERLATSVRLSYPTEPGRSYRVEYTDSLVSPAWRVLEDFTGDGAVHRYLDPIRPGANRFYRLAGF